jgi:hypothetical protein
MSVLLPWLWAYLVTQVIEVPLYLQVTGSWRVSFLASTLTHPVVWFVFPGLMRLGWSYWAMVAAAELFAVAAEALWLKVNGVQRALLWSFVVNAVSATGGLLLREAFGAP